MSREESTTQIEPIAVKNVHRLGRNLIHRVSVCLKNASLYDSANINVQDGAKELIRTVRAIHGMDDSAKLDVVLDFIALNEVRIRPPMEGHLLFKSLIDGLSSRDIGALQFLEDLTVEDVTNFCRLFHSVDPDDDAPFARLTEGMESNGIHRILERGNSKKVNFRRARRVVQNLVNTVSEDDFFLLALTSIKNYDEYTFNHSSNVAVYSIALGQRLGLNRQDLADVGLAGLLHDIGKTMVPPEILNKPGRLDPDEWEKMKDHSVYGAEALLRGSQITDSVIRYVLVAFEHHLRLDLDGYPDLMDRRELSLFSKIVAIADSFDALTTSRPYRSTGYKPHEALGIMMEGQGTLFDPVLLKIFVNAIGVHPIGTVVQLESGELGVVIRTNPNPRDLDKPIIKIFRNIDGNNVPVHVKDLSERDPDGNLIHKIVSTGNPGDFFESIEDYIDVL